MKTKVIKRYRDDGTLRNEHEVLETDENKLHGEYKFYFENGSYDESLWFFESKYIGGNQEGKQKFKELNKPYVFLNNCKKLGVK